MSVRGDKHAPLAHVGALPRTFDTSTIEGLKAAEQYKARLEKKFNRVIVITVGFNRVRIFGRDKIAK